MDETPPVRRPWIREAARTAANEARQLAATIAAFARHPFRFAEEWRAGTSAPMNPIGVVAGSAVVVGAMRQAAMAVLGAGDDRGLLASALTALGPYVHYAALALICHVVLRITTGRRVSLGDSIAIGLYAGGGPAAIAESLVWLVVIALGLSRSAVSPVVIGVGLGVAFSVFCITFAVGLSGLFHPRPWQIIAAFAIAFPLIGLVFGQLHPPGNYGMHWVLILAGPAAPHLSLGL